MRLPTGDCTAAFKISRTSASVLRPEREARALSARAVSSGRFLTVMAAIGSTFL
jgi:hypothetical protein